LVELPGGTVYWSSTGKDVEGLAVLVSKRKV
jgi:hypothetical protein